jgi:hypothetical protein
MAATTVPAGTQRKRGGLPCDIFVPLILSGRTLMT